MKITATIKSVKDHPKAHDGRTGKIFFIDGEFQEGEFSTFAKSEQKAQEIITSLTGLIGKPEQYEVEEKGVGNGRPQYKLVDYPGKPAYGGGGFAGRGGGGYQPRYRDSEQGAKEERDSIARSVALQQSVVLANSRVHPADDNGVIETAELFYQWLVKNNQPVSQPFDPGTQQAASTPQEQARPASQMVQRANSLFGDQEQPRAQAPSSGRGDSCPKCGGKDAVRKSKLDGTPPWYCYKKIGGCGHQWGEYSPQLTREEPAEQKTPAVMASEEISKAVKTRDADYLNRVAKRVADCVISGSISQSECDELDVEITTAKQAIDSGIDHEEWYKRTLRAVQNRETESSPEMQDLGDRF